MLRRERQEKNSAGRENWTLDAVQNYLKFEAGDYSGDNIVATKEQSF